jgi:hypothetical protein
MRIAVPCSRYVPHIPLVLRVRVRHARACARESEKERGGVGGGGVGMGVRVGCGVRTCGCVHVSLTDRGCSQTAPSGEEEWERGRMEKP